MTQKKIFLFLIVVGVGFGLYWFFGRTLGVRKNDLKSSNSQIQQTTNGAKFSIQKSEFDGQKILYVLRGTVLAAPKEIDGFFVCDMAIDGDESTTPIRLLLGSSGSSIDFAQAVASGRLTWQGSTVGEVADKLQKDQAVEIRVIVDPAETASAVWKEVLDTLYSSDSLAGKRLGFQPKMIAIIDK